MKIAVCAKFTPDTEDVRVSANGDIDVSRATWNVSDYDVQAAQAAADMAGADDEIVAISAGTSVIGQAKLVKSLLARGNFASMIRVADDSLADADAAVIANVLAAAVKHAGADVVLFGEGSSDLYARTTGSLVAAALGWDCVNGVDAISVEGDAIVVERDLDDGIEVVELQTPCVLAVTSTINQPAIPNMKAVLAAGKKPVEDLTVAGLGVEVANKVAVTASAAPEKPGRQCLFIDGTPEEIAEQLVAKLRADAVL